MLSDEDKECYEHGFITADLIKKLAPEEYSVFICGPRAMYRFLESELPKLELPAKFIRREIMGVANDAAEKMVAFVPCSGTEGVAEMRFHYTGPQDCQAAMLFGGKSNKMCTFACVGLGNCVRACQFDAMHIVDGIAKVDRSRCVGCGACVDICPKSIVKLIPESQKIMPVCSNRDKGAKVMRLCGVGCIGCMKCQRECPADAIAVKDNLAVVDPAKCVQCGHCADICPRHIITWFGK